VLPKQTVVSPSGIVTQPNEYGQLPPGTLLRGDGLRIRRKGIIEPRPDLQFYAANTDCDKAYKAWPINYVGGFRGEGLFEGSPHPSDRVIFVDKDLGGEDRLRMIETNSYDGVNPKLYTLSAPTFPQISRSLTFSPGKTQLSVARDRSFITNDVAPVVVDRRYSDPAFVGGGPFARPAGLPPVQIQMLLNLPEVGEGLAARDHTIDYPWVAYKAVLRWTDPLDPGYVIWGAVSNAIAGRTNGKIGLPCNLRAVWLPGTYFVSSGILGPPAQTVIEFYRTEFQDSFDLLGDAYRYAFEHEINFADFVNGYADCVDTAYETGADIYTINGGPTQSNLPPPPSNDVVTYKGATFYTSTSVAHSFTAKINWWGNYRYLETENERTYGIGIRTILVMTTAGSPIIDVSPLNPNGTPSMLGIVAGQTFQCPGLPSVATITSVNPAGEQFTVSINATVQHDEFVEGFAVDRIFINEVPLSLANAAAFSYALADAQIAGLPVVCFADPVLSMAPADDPATDLPSGQELLFVSPVSGTSAFTVGATNGQNYSPPFSPLYTQTKSSDNDARTNRVHHSKINQPEAVPIPNSFLVGNGTLLKLMVTQDMLVGFSTDGIYRISGDGDDWSVTILDRDTVLLAPDAADSMDAVIYAWTSAGFISLSDGGEGIKKLSAPLIGEDVRVLRKTLEQALPVPPFTWNTKVVCDKHKNEVWFSYLDLADTGVPGTNYIWNTETATFVTANNVSATAMTYSSFLQSPIFFIGDDLWQYDLIYGSYMPTNVVFNALVGDDVGYLKQWVDVTLLLEDLSNEMDFWPSFELVDYPESYPVYPVAGSFEHVVPVLQNYNYNKHCQFGFMASDRVFSNLLYWRLKGLAYRYRLASETMRQ
jgi:hypothetical protein